MWFFSNFYYSKTLVYSSSEYYLVNFVSVCTYFTNGLVKIQNASVSQIATEPYHDQPLFLFFLSNLRLLLLLNFIGLQLSGIPTVCWVLLLSRFWDLSELGILALGAILRWMVSFSKNTQQFVYPVSYVYMCVCVHVSAHVCVCAHGWLSEVILECHSPSAFAFWGSLSLEPPACQWGQAGSPWCYRDHLSPPPPCFQHTSFLTWGLRGLNSGPHASTVSILPTDHLSALFLYSESLPVPPAH